MVIGFMTSTLETLTSGEIPRLGEKLNKPPCWQIRNTLQTVFNLHGENTNTLFSAVTRTREKIYCKNIPVHEHGYRQSNNFFCITSTVKVWIRILTYYCYCYPLYF